MIPKIIHFCWLSNDPYPETIQKCLNSWKKFLPDYEIWKWDFNRFPKGTSKWVDQAFEKKKYAFAADYIRLYALYHFGGIYLDSDVEILKSFDSLLQLPYFIGMENTPKGIEAATLGCEKHWNLIELLYNRYKDKNFAEADGTLHMEPMPAIFRKCIETNYELHPIHSITEFIKDNNFINVFPIDWFSPKTWDTKEITITPNTYSIHHFAGSWLNSSNIQKKESLKNKVTDIIKKIFSIYKKYFFYTHPYSIVSNIPLAGFYYRNCGVNNYSPFADTNLFENDFFNAIDNISSIKKFELNFIKINQSKYCKILDDYFSIALENNYDIEIHFHNLPSRQASMDSWEQGQKQFNIKKVKYVFVKANPNIETIRKLEKSHKNILLITNKESSYKHQMVIPSLTEQNEKTLSWINGKTIRRIVKQLKK